MVYDCRACGASLRSPIFSRMDYCPYCGNEIRKTDKSRKKTEMDYFHQGISLYTISDYKRASQQFRKGVDRNPHSILLRYSLALSHLEDDRLEQFLDEIAVCFEIDPQWPKNRFYLRITDNPFNITTNTLSERCLEIIVLWVKEGRFFIKNTKQFINESRSTRLENEGKLGKTRGRTKLEKAAFWIHESHRLMKAAMMLSPRNFQFWIEKNEKRLLSGGGCFIATAAFGSNMTNEVIVLRSWRDRVLLPSGHGKFLTELYYAISPPIAKIIRKSDWLRIYVSKTLKPISRAAGRMIEKQK